LGTWAKKGRERRGSFIIMEGGKKKKTTSRAGGVKKGEKRGETAYLVHKKGGRKEWGGGVAGSAFL